MTFACHEHRGKYIFGQLTIDTPMQNNKLHIYSATLLFSTAEFRRTHLAGQKALTAYQPTYFRAIFVAPRTRADRATVFPCALRATVNGRVCAVISHLTASNKCSIDIEYILVGSLYLRLVFYRIMLCAVD